MEVSRRIRFSTECCLAAIFLCLASGCSSFPSLTLEEWLPKKKEQLDEELVLPPSVDSLQTPASQTADAPSRVSLPETDEPTPRYQPRVAVFLSSRSAFYDLVATSLENDFENYEIFDLSDQSLPAEQAFDLAEATGVEAIITVGYPAARSAESFASMPVIVTQVFNLQTLNFDSSTRAVSALPPMDLQVERWLTVTPGLRSVGAIVGEGHESLLEETREALEAKGLSFHYAVVGSDQETLYYFERLAPLIDGFVLFPDNRVLSRSVIQKLMQRARSEGIRVAVFNDQLLPMGAVMSSTTELSDMSRVVSRVVADMLSGKVAQIPFVSPLNSIKVRINEGVLERVRRQSGRSTVSGRIQK